MISILIPTYNYSITRLVTDLYQQALDTYVDFEIIVMEDGSTLFVEENNSVNDFEFCRHIVLKDNSGRSSVRNKLADEAKYDHLLFLDCDAEVCSSNFVAKYVAFCKEECIVIGGTAYDPDEKDPRYSLRLAYGRQREASSAIDRSKEHAYHNFATFNFLISKSLFDKVRFDESIRGYGHEDTLFGHQLHELGYQFIHIENPIIHKGLDDNATFLRKTEEGVLNLFLLYKTQRYPFLIHESKLLNSFVRVYKTGMTQLFSTVFIVVKPFLQYKLSSPSPSLRLYDIYKLLLLCEASASK
ncbi:MAG: glycosyltransferase family 2 protein [Bacteroidota bacterium]|nr:glycosyltransferase family 2 protein [Bacteroidota bacterium]